MINTGTILGDITQSQGGTGGGPARGASAAAPRRSPRSEDGFSYDVALSYAGEQERLVARVAKILEADGFRVFFAPRREEEFVGEDMISRFYRIYRYESRYVAAFVTEDYLKKDITKHEASTAMLRQKEEGRSCLIPFYFQGAKLDHLDQDVNYIPADGLREVEMADKIRAVLLRPDRG